MKSNILAGAMMISLPHAELLLNDSYIATGNSKPESFNRLSQKGRRKRARQARSGK